MATYKKRGAKKSISKPEVTEQQEQSTTAEVFETLDQSASRTEAFVAEYQNYILIFIGVVTVGVLGYLGYNSFIYTPQQEEAVSELNQAQYYFNLAINETYGEAFYQQAIEGADGKFGFQDIIDNYSGTPAGDLAIYSTGMAHFNLKQYQEAINYLEDFSSDDVLLSALALGATGDAYAALNQAEKALARYESAFKASDNDFTMPKYLYKAGLLSAQLNKNGAALKYFKQIKADFPEAQEAQQIDIQIARLENLN